MAIEKKNEDPEDFYKAKYGDLVFVFSKYDKKASGFIAFEHLKDALNDISCKREKKAIVAALKEIRKSGDISPLNFTEFKRLYYELCQRDPTINSVESASQKLCIYQYGTSSHNVNDGTLHSVTEEEQIAFSGWISRNLKKDTEAKKYFPFDESGEDLYEKCRDGIILCKIINVSVPKTIDFRAVNMGSNLTTFQKNENNTLALNSARAIGCNVVNIGAADIQDCTKHLLLGVLWQIIKKGLLRQINIVAKAELATLLEPNESIGDFAKLSPESILMRWVNFHLKHTESDARMDNFSFDIKAILDAVDLVQRAEMVLQNAEQLDCRVFVRPKDIVSGSQRLNLAFLANLFNTNPALEPVDVDISSVEETREEKTYRNWINSMGLKPAVNNLYTDLYNGLVLFKLCDMVQTSTVNWNKVHQKFNLGDPKANFQYLENCNYAVQIGKDFGFSLVGVSGSDLRDGNVTLTLAFIWQLMRAYTLSMLANLASKAAELGAKTAQEKIEENNVSVQLGRSKKSGKVYAPIDESQLITWANRQLHATKKTSRLSTKLGFHDISLNDAVLIIDLIDAIKPSSIDYDLVKFTMQEECKKSYEEEREDRLENAKYAIAVARKIGAKVYAVPEDITESKSKMIMTIFACLMTVQLENHAESCNCCSKFGGISGIRDSIKPIPYEAIMTTSQVDAYASTADLKILSSPNLSRNNSNNRLQQSTKLSSRPQSSISYDAGSRPPSGTSIKREPCLMKRDSSYSRNGYSTSAKSSPMLNRKVDNYIAEPVKVKTIKINLQRPYAKVPVYNKDQDEECITATHCNVIINSLSPIEATQTYCLPVIPYFKTSNMEFKRQSAFAKSMSEIDIKEDHFVPARQGFSYNSRNRYLITRRGSEHLEKADNVQDQEWIKDETGWHQKMHPTNGNLLTNNDSPDITTGA